MAATDVKQASFPYDDEKLAYGGKLYESDTDSVDDDPISEKTLLAQHRDYDVESLKHVKEHAHVPAATTGAEYTVSTRTKLVYLAGYFALNLLLTIYNKAVLGSVCGVDWCVMDYMWLILLQFAFPWLLTTLHCSFVTVGCYTLLAMGRFRLTPLTMRENLILTAFSFLFTVNIAISTVSLYVIPVI